MRQASETQEFQARGDIDDAMLRALAVMESLVQTEKVPASIFETESARAALLATDVEGGATQHTLVTSDAVCTPQVLQAMTAHCISRRSS